MKMQGHLERRCRRQRRGVVEVQSQRRNVYALPEAAEAGGHAKDTDHQRRGDLVLTTRKRERTRYRSAVSRHG